LQRKKKRKIFLAPINLRFKKAQQLTISNAFPAQDFIRTRDITYMGCSFKFILKVGTEEFIVNAPLVSLQSKNINDAKSEVKFKQLIRDLCLL
jgi:hypothetical protein